MSIPSCLLFFSFCRVRARTVAMASSLQRTLTFLKPFPSPTTKSPAAVAAGPRYVRVRCGGRGPRARRLPLMKGRILSIEAIQAIQTLKRLQRANPTDLSHLVSNTLSRLLKSDLKATLKELLRQDQCALALRAFSIFRSEYKVDLSLYAEMVEALARNGMAEEVDRLILDLEAEGGIQCDDKGLVNLIKAVIGAGSRESTARIYGLMKMSGWGSSVEPDDYVVQVLGNGLKSFGELGLAEELENESKKALVRFSRGKLETLKI